MVNAAPNLNKINEAAEIRSPTRVENLVCWIPLGPLCREGRRPSVTGGTCRSSRRHWQSATLSGDVIAGSFEHSAMWDCTTE